MINSAINSARNWLRRHPRAYDLSVRLRRAIGITTPIAEVLHHFSLANNRCVRFIQIGASDGLHSDPIREFIVRDRWSGVLVEPLPESFELLQRNYRYLHHKDITFVNAAITVSYESSLTFWTFSDTFLIQFSDEDKLNYIQKSSFHREHVAGLLETEIDRDIHVIAINVKYLSLFDLINKYFKYGDIDLLVTDCEGYEAELISETDWRHIRPKAILFESHNLGVHKDKVNTFLTSCDYQLYELGGDTLAISREFLVIWKARSRWAQRHLAVLY